MPTDTASAAEFYTKVVGWTAKDSGMPGVDYTILGVPGYDMGVAGMMQLTEEMKARGIPPHWTGYVAVDDVDAMARKFADNGGTVHHAPEDIPASGARRRRRSAGRRDQPSQGDHAGRPDAAGTRCRHARPSAGPEYGCNGERHTSIRTCSAGRTWPSTWARWIYQCFAKDGKAIGGMMTKPPMVTAPFWGYYITVDAIDAAVERVKQAGGKILFGPEPVPGGSFILQCEDPQGAYFALTASKR
jgi:predicted enzyme related to lactoylglutathione lyase